MKTHSKELKRPKGKHQEEKPQRQKGLKEGAVVELVWQLAEPICQSEGMELVHVEYRREPGGRILRIYIDRAGGVALDDCAVVSRQLSDILDVHLDEKVPAYHLEISSPGSQRPIGRLNDFERFKGQDARIKLKTPIDGRRNFKGVLEGFTKGTVHLRVGTVKMDIDYQNIAKAKLVNHNGEN